MTNTKKKHSTLYETSYGIVESRFREEMTFEEAEEKGKAYCEEKGLKYHGTFTQKEVGNAKAELLKSL